MQTLMESEFRIEAHRRAALVRTARDTLRGCVNGSTTGACEKLIEAEIIHLQNLYEQLLDSNGGD